MKRLLLLAVLLVAVCSTPVQAAYIYSYDVDPLPFLFNYHLDWSFEVPSLLTTTTTIPASALLSGLTTHPTPIASVQIYNPFSNHPFVNTFFEPGGAVDELSSTGYGQPFDAPGVYFIGSPEETGALTITETSEPIPEPISMVLLASGLAGLAGLKKRICR